jgi:hypothetical protein
MKNKILLLLTLAIIATPVFAGSSDTLQSAVDYNASGSTEASADLVVGSSAGDTSGDQAVIWGITGKTDKDGAIVSILIGDETGVTTSYTIVSQIPVSPTTDRNVVIGFEDKPIFIGSLNYSYQVQLDSTATNALNVVWEKR